MSRTVKIALVLVSAAVLGTVGLLIFIGRESFTHRCEVCVEEEGRTACMQARGASVEEARKTAHESACGVLHRTRAGRMACTRRPTVSDTCEPGPTVVE